MPGVLKQRKTERCDVERGGEGEEAAMICHTTANEA